MMYVQDALMALLLWRGTLRLELFGKSLMFPIHSLAAFLLAVFLVERPQLLPSFCFASIAWLLLATMGSPPMMFGVAGSYGELIGPCGRRIVDSSINALNHERTGFREAYHGNPRITVARNQNHCAGEGTKGMENRRMIRMTKAKDCDRFLLTVRT
jgi:hypothetical protein